VLKPDADRLDYGELLRAPENYCLHAALATTYSLDLETLAAASLALTLDHTLEEEEEGELTGERVALLEAIDRLQKRLLVFYQRGNIKIPNRFNRLFTLLEPLLAPTEAIEGEGGAFASFHPKVWLLRFVSDKEAGAPECWRLIVLSRNLTFDRSWDLAVSFDGKTDGRRRTADPELVAFLRSVTRDPAHSACIDEWCEALASVVWKTPDPFDGAFDILPGRSADGKTPHSVPLALDGELDDVLVVAPFVDAGDHSMLRELGCRTRANGTRTLVSRGDTLDRIGEKRLEGWTVLSLPSSIVDAEERNEEKSAAPQNLHAKLIVAKQGRHAIWHVGSANMTDAAFGRPGKAAPRNRELMIRLTGTYQSVGPARLLEQWTAARLFRPHVFSKSGPLAPEADRVMRLVIHALASADWQLHVQETSPDQYHVRLDVQPEGLAERLPAGYTATVRLLCGDDARPLASSLSWQSVRLTDISAFLPVEVRPPKGEPVRFAVQATFSVDLLDQRKRAVFKDVVGNSEKLLRYLTLVLDADPSRSEWSRADRNGGAFDIFGLDGKGALYEQLLRATSRAPRRISRAIEIFRRVRAEVDKLPEGLDVLIDGFDGYNNNSANV
jgi:hypothetical protein